MLPRLPKPTVPWLWSCSSLQLAILNSTCDLVVAVEKLNCVSAILFILWLSHLNAHLLWCCYENAYRSPGCRVPSSCVNAWFQLRVRQIVNLLGGDMIYVLKLLYDAVLGYAGESSLGLQRIKSNVCCLAKFVALQHMRVDECFGSWLRHLSAHDLSRLRECIRCDWEGGEMIWIFRR